MPELFVWATFVSASGAGKVDKEEKQVGIMTLLKIQYKNVIVHAML